MFVNSDVSYWATQGVSQPCIVTNTKFVIF